MTLNNTIKRLRDIMRNDAGVNGDAQRIEQIAWILFLKIYDAQEELWELDDENYKSIIPEELRWRSWAVDNKDGKALTGGELTDFVNEKLFKTLKGLVIYPSTPLRSSIVKTAFADKYNYMKDGVLLRQVVNTIDEIDFADYDDRHAFGDIYEQMLKELQSAGSSGEFYTPRALTDFIVMMADPKIGEKVADFACGTGGFLSSTLKHLRPQAGRSTENLAKFKDSVYGIEKKPLPYILCVTNMLLHDVDEPRIVYGNSLEKNVRDFGDADKFDVVVMNPPYGGSEKEIIKMNFPAEMRSSETADLFVILIMYRLKKSGRAAIILPDGFLFGTDGAKAAIKKKLLAEFDLHTVVRLPGSVFAPYTGITTNLLFFDAGRPTKETWFYRMDMPEGCKHFSKTRPLSLMHMKPIADWWKNRAEIQDADGAWKSKKFTAEELTSLSYNLDQCGFPNKTEEILPPGELIAQYQTQRAELNEKIDGILEKITAMLEETGHGKE